MFANGFKNPLGVLAITGGFYFPAALYAVQHGLWGSVAVCLLAVFSVGRCIAFGAEGWFVAQYFIALLRADVAAATE